jgi:hypothetical protein
MIPAVAPPRNASIARLLALALAAATGAHAALWVSSGGDDRNPGTEEQPLRTIERARDIVRTMNRDMSDDITVFIGGTFRIARPIEFGPEDSGKNGFSIVYTSAPGEHPVLSGGFPVAGWNLADRSRNLWWAPAPDGLADSHDLFVNGVQASRTRGRLVQAFVRSPAGATVAAPDARVQWRNPGDIVFSQSDPGAIWSERLGAPPFFVVNAFELLGTPGEWYFDRPAKRIYYTPRAGEDMAAADVEAAAAEALIDGNGTQGRPLNGLIFKGIRFEFTTSLHSPGEGSGPQPPGGPAAAVRFTHAGAIQFLEDDFVHLGTPALDLGPGFEGGTVEGCVFADVAWTALRIADASQVRVANSRFSYVATAHPEAAAIDLGRSAAVVVEHDQIDHFPRFAILPAWGQSGASRRAMNLISPPMIDYDGRPPEGDPREPVDPDAGVSAAYKGILGERFCGPTVPRAPTNVSAEPGDRSAYVTWDPPCLDGGSPVASYTIASSSGAMISISAAEFRTRGYVALGNLENGHAVNFTVAAATATGASPPSLPTANVVPARKKKLKPPQPPKAASVEHFEGEARIQVTPPAADGGSPVLAYSFASVPSGKRVDLEGWDVIHASAEVPVVRTISGYPLDSVSAIAISATNAAGEGKPVILSLQR